MIPQELVDQIRDEYNSKKGDWMGCDWNQDFSVGYGKRPLYTDEWEINTEADPEEEAQKILAEDRESKEPSWNTDDLDSLTDAVRKVQEFLIQCTKDAEQAEELMEDALEAFESGEYTDATNLAEKAVGLEDSNGDSPTWGT